MSEKKGVPQYRLVLGDCLEKLKELPDCSVDAVVTDPPYDLTGASGSGGFMGKKWDATGIAFRPDVWLECLRVLKPGGHLLSFGGTRTYHRMACAIEDAGFEIRDSIHWMYGSGFPKSLDVSKAIDKRRDDRADVLRVTAWIRERRDAAGVTNAEIDAAFGFCGMAGHWSSSASQPAVPTLDQIPTLLSILGVSEEDVPAEIRRLLFELNGRKGQPGEAWYAREVIEERTMTQGGGTSLQLRMGEKRDVSADITAPATDDARTWLGWGTALKPAHEPIVVARKPLIGTVAQNVLEHGTGAINVDGCRVGSAGGTRRDGKADQPNASGWENMRGHGIAELNAGRWPPNVIFSHLPECRQVGTKKVKGSAPASGPTLTGASTSNSRGHFNGVAGTPSYADLDGFETVEAWECAEGCAVRELDAQSGTRTSGKPGVRRKPHETGSMSGRLGLLGEQETGYGDTGGASRFFPAFRYQAKASRSEREAGLEAAPTRDAGAAMNTRCSKCDRLKLDHPASRCSCAVHVPAEQTSRAGVKNHHPTVKPVDLMRWLVRLVTPPGGVVLDPFTGSGTTGVAAIREGFHFLGIEREAEYEQIARARISVEGAHDIES